jgi:hypothetical protein
MPFYGVGYATVYYLTGATGWGTTFGGLPTKPFPFTYTILNGTATINGYSGTGNAATIPSVIEGLPVTSLGSAVFSSNPGLVSITIPASVTNIANGAFSACTNLAAIYFAGNAPSVGPGLFTGIENATVFYMPGATGWGPTFAGRPTAPFPFSYVTDSGEVSITRYTGTGSGATIPDTIDGLSVSSIGDSAFQDCTSLTRVTLPDGMAYIGPLAFWNCSSLASITLPDSVSYIGEGAFYACNSLASVTLPSRVTSLGDYVFASCTNLSAITVAALNPAYSSVDGVLFNFDKTKLIQYPGGKAGRYAIPESVTWIGNYAFCGCPGMSDIAIPDSVTTLGDGVFYTCNSLSSITLPASVNTLGSAVFYACPALTSVYFLGNAPGQSYEMFTGTENATVYYRPGTLRWDTTFGGRPAMLLPYTYAVLGDTVAIISYDGANTVEIIPSSLEGKPVTAIGSYAFFNCTMLTGVTLPNGVTSIGNSAFKNCSGLTYISIPSGVTNIGASAFENCTGLTSVALPASVTAIGDAAFFNCSGLTSVMLPEGVASIGNWAFAGCDGLTGVTLPASVRHLGNYAFGYCAELAGLYFKGDAPSFGLSVLAGSGGVSILYLPGTAGWNTPVAGHSPVFWNPRVQASGGVGVRSGGLFGFTLLGTNSMAIAVEACTNLSGAVWTPVTTVTLVNGAADFTDAASTNHPARFYRFRMP